MHHEQVVVRDIYDRKDLGVATAKFTATVAHHYGMAIKLTPIEYGPCHTYNTSSPVSADRSG